MPTAIPAFAPVDRPDDPEDWTSTDEAEGRIGSVEDVGVTTFTVFGNGDENAVEVGREEVEEKVEVTFGAEDAEDERELGAVDVLEAVSSPSDGPQR
ncbi:hypothetical protein ABW19_dt0206025 [Dactylella cylindrospora]|nr:hypothetical protein ABW19_dt0206025 [Dactylella cylindrospora]